MVSSDQWDVITTVNLTVSTFSFVGSLFTIVSFLMLPALRKFAFRLVFFLACAEICWSMSNLFGRPSDGSALCYIQAYLSSFFELASVCWTSAIAYCLHMSLHFPNKVDLPNRMRRFHLLCWGIPFLLTLLPQTTSSYGQAGPFCWIEGQGVGSFWRFFQFYVPLWCLAVYNGRVYFKCLRTLHMVEKRLAAEDEHHARPKRRLILLAYPLVLLVCWVFGTVNRLQNWITPGQPVFWLNLLHVMFGNSMPFLHAVVYGRTALVRRALRMALCPHWYGEADAEAAEEERLEEEEAAGMEAPVETAHGGEETELVALHPAKPSEEDEEEEESNQLLVRRESVVESLSDVSYQIRGAYVANLGVYELIGLQHAPTEHYRHLQTLGKTAVGRVRRKPSSSGLEADVEEQVVYPKKRQGNGVTSTYFTLYKSFVGIGVLALPHAYMQAGYVLATVGLITVAWVSYYCVTILVRCKEHIEHTPELRESLGEGGHVTFAGVGYVACGVAGAYTIDSSLVFSMVGFCITYLIFVGKNVSVAIASPDVGPTLIIVASAVLLTPLVWLRSLRRLVVTSLIADAVIFFGLIVVLCYDFVEISDDHKHAETESFRFLTFPLFFGVAVFAMEGIGLVLPLHQSMREPHKFTGIVKVVFITLTALMCAFGAFGYLAYGAQTKDIITLNIRVNPLTRTAMAVYSLGLIFTYPIVLFPAVVIVEGTATFRRIPSYKFHIGSVEVDVVSKLFRVLVVAFTALVACTVPHFGLFVDLIGSVACTLIAFILPTIFYIRLAPDQGTDTAWARAKHIGIIVFGVLGAVTSFAITVREFVLVYK